MQGQGIVLTSGYNLLNDSTGKDLKAADNEYVFIYDISTNKLVQLGVVPKPAAYAGIAWKNPPDGMLQQYAHPRGPRRIGCRIPLLRRLPIRLCHQERSISDRRNVADQEPRGTVSVPHVRLPFRWNDAAIQPRRGRSEYQ